MNKRYKVLRFIGSLYKVMGAALAIFTILGAIGSCLISIFSGSVMDSMMRSYSDYPGFSGLFSGVLGGVIAGFFLLLYGGISAALLYAFGELIFLLIDIEENTRSVAIRLNR